MKFPDIQAVIESGLDDTDREPDGLFHCSKHTWWPLRFSQLEFAQLAYMKSGGVSGKPAKMTTPQLLDRITMLTGTLHHTWIEEQLKKYKFPHPFELVATEVNLEPYLPDGWTGTADWVFYDKDQDHCILGDYKTIKPEGIQYLNGKPKEEHILQLSAYYYALEKAGYTMAPNSFVFYLPKGRLWSHEVKPAQINFAPWASINSLMDKIKLEVGLYVNGNQSLAPMPPPEYKKTWNAKMSVFDVKQHPNWMEAYTCPFDESLCPRTLVKKVGHWALDRQWYSKSGMEPICKPTDSEFRKRGG